MAADPLTQSDYQVLAGIRHALRGFMHFSEQAAEQAGLTPQQHQALLAIRAENGSTVGELAERLLIRPHSATGLADRLTRLGLIERHPSSEDRRRVELVPTPKANELLQSLSATHRAELRRLRPLLTRLLDTL